MIKYGEALTKAGWVEEAIEIFERANKLQAKSNTQLYGSWARALSARDGLAAAEKKLLAADGENDADESRGGRDARIHRIRGDILRDHDQPIRAMNEYRIAVALDPQDALAYQNWGRILLESDKDDDLTIAIEKLRLAIAKDKQSPEARYYLGRALLRQGDVVAAVEAFENAAKVASPHQAKEWTGMAGKLLKEPNPMELVKKLAPTMCSSERKKRPILAPEAAMPEQALHAHVPKPRP